jgi:hypothetical protein
MEMILLKIGANMYITIIIYISCKNVMLVCNTNVIFKYFWVIGGIMDFQIMRHEDICF